MQENLHVNDSGKKCIDKESIDKSESNEVKRSTIDAMPLLKVTHTYAHPTTFLVIDNLPRHKPSSMKDQTVKLKQNKSHTARSSMYLTYAQL
jgi:hypothetical protein